MSGQGSWILCSNRDASPGFSQFCGCRSNYIGDLGSGGFCCYDSSVVRSPNLDWMNPRAATGGRVVTPRDNLSAPDQHADGPAQALRPRIRSSESEV